MKTPKILGNDYSPPIKGPQTANADTGKAAGVGAKPVKRDAKWGQTWYSKDVRSG